MVSRIDWGWLLFAKMLVESHGSTVVDELNPLVRMDEAVVNCVLSGIEQGT